MASAPRCHLLALPPEPRIQIYGYLFGEETWVYVTDPIPHDPAIMRTCREIRTEALDTYEKYIDHIVFEVKDCDVARVVLWHARAAHHCSGFMWLMMGRPVLSNLLVWLGYYYESKCPRISAGRPDELPWVKGVSYVFDVLDELQYKNGLY